MSDQPTFRDRLLESEPLDLELRKTYEREIENMFERKLTPVRKAAFAMTIVVGLGSAALCGFLALTEPELPPLARAGLSTGVLFGVAWAVVSFVIVRRGAINLKTHGHWMASMVWIFTLLMVIFFLMIAASMDDQLRGLLMVANGLVFLICAAVHWISYKIDDARLSTREKLLELELRLAELAEGSFKVDVRQTN